VGVVGPLCDTVVVGLLVTEGLFVPLGLTLGVAVAVPVTVVVGLPEVDGEGVCVVEPVPEPVLEGSGETVAEAEIVPERVPLVVAVIDAVLEGERLPDTVPVPEGVTVSVPVPVSDASEGTEPGDTVAEGVGGTQAVRPTLPLYPLAPAVAITAGQLAAENALARARFTKLLPPPPPH
jgi:hypothetical protein